MRERPGCWSSRRKVRGNGDTVEEEVRKPRNRGRGEDFPLCKQTGRDTPKRVKKEEREEVGLGELGDSRKGKERGRTGKEELLKENPWEKGETDGGEQLGVAAPRVPRRALYVTVLELPPMSVPSQPGLHTLPRSHRCGRA